MERKSLESSESFILLGEKFTYEISDIGENMHITRSIDSSDKIDFVIKKCMYKKLVKAKIDEIDTIELLLHLHKALVIKSSIITSNIIDRIIKEYPKPEVAKIAFKVITIYDLFNNL